MVKVLAVLFAPLWAFGWILGICLRPCWIGFVHGFNAILVYYAKGVDKKFADIVTKEYGRNFDD